jgi:hypothetical protein
VEEEGSARRRGARPGRLPGQAGPCPPEQLAGGGQKRGGQDRPDDAEIGEHLQVSVVVKPVDAQAAIRADPAQGPVPGPHPGHRMPLDHVQCGGRLPGSVG